METEYFVERSATRKDPDKEDGPESRPLDAWNELDAYVLLAEPGAGKSEAFKHEAKRGATSAVYITARSFLTIGPPPGWQADQVLFIDALDERRSDASTSLSALDELRKKLNDLGRPKFRLSCREADWFAGGIKDLGEVAPRGEVSALWLDPLTEADTQSLLWRWSPARVKDPVQFMVAAKQHGMAALMTNPLLLGLLVDAVKDDRWPRNRHEIYDLACGQMASEHNEVRAATMAMARPLSEDLLAAAGRLCALLLVADAAAISTNVFTAAEPRIVNVRDLPKAFIQDTLATQECLKTKLFTSEGGEFFPRHRTIAEYLAAKAIAEQVKRSLPVRRVLTLISGSGGRIVEPLRALYAWLSLQSANSRWLLLRLDPMALVLYGDVRPFLRSEKESVLDALYRQGKDFRWFRSENWDAQPFGAMGTVDMATVFSRWLRSASREPAHQSVLECIADAIAHGDAGLALRAELEQVVRDSTYDDQVREHALDAWLGKLDGANAAKTLLEDVHIGIVADETDELTGALLEFLYPQDLTALEAIRYLRAARRKNFIAQYHMFWASSFEQGLTTEDLPTIADKLVGLVRPPILSSEDETDAEQDSLADQLALRVVDAALKAHGTAISGERLYRWLGIGVNRYGTFDTHEPEARSITFWLTAHPLQRRAAFEAGLGQVAPSKPDGQRHFYVVEERMFRSRRPAQWGQWLLDIAGESDDEDVAKFCFQEAASAVISPFFEHDLKIEDIEAWVAKQSSRWPSAETWKLEKFVWSLDSYQRQQHEYEITSRREAQTERDRRQRAFAPHLAALETAGAPATLLSWIAGAYLKRVSGQGETPLERVQDMLVVDESRAQRVIHGLRYVLERSDLPTPAEILDAWCTSERKALGLPCLLAAELVCNEDLRAWEHWSETLQQTLVALYCAEGNSEPNWYRPLCANRPGVVAGIVGAFAAHSMANSNGPQLRALYGLRDESAPVALAQLLLPEIWRLTPQAPEGQHLHFFETVTLRSSIDHLEECEWRLLVEQKLSQAGIGDEIAIALHLAAVRFAPALHTQAILAICLRAAPMVSALAHSLTHLGRGDIEALATIPTTTGRLIELLATGTQPERPDSVIDYSTVDRLREAAQKLLRGIVNNPAREAGEELRRLRDTPGLAGWSVYLDSLLFEHARLANRSSYAAPSLADVVKVLTNGPPVSSRDMAELARDHLSQLAAKIRFEESNLRRTFYRTVAKPKSDKSKAATKSAAKAAARPLEIPRIENDCRDVLLGLINERLGDLGVRFAKEASYAEDTRADLQVESMIGSKSIVVPVEVKKDDHPEVWSAWREQLEARYMTHPKAQGIGMYVVLWFGHKTKTAQGGRKPRSAQEMAQMLDELIPDDRRNHIVGLVIDLTKHRP